MTPLSLETSGLGKQYGHMWAPQDCSLRVPPGRVGSSP
jgi:hypothetical protein